MPCVTPLRLSVALAGAGWHPAAWREPDARPQELVSAGYWTELVQEAERGKLDFVTLEDAPALAHTHLDGPDGRTDQVRDRPDVALLAARVAPLTSRIGLIPTVTTPHTEPFQLSTSIATLDHVSSGRAGLLARTARPGETADVEDRSITPPSPQGQPVVTALASSPADFRFAARSADLVFVTPQDEDDVRRIVDDVRRIVDEVRAEQTASGRAGAELKIFAELVVFLAGTEADAIDRKSRLDDLVGHEFRSDAAVFVGTPEQLIVRLQSWQRAGIEGFRLRPGALPHDLLAITRGLVPVLQENDAFRRGYEAKTLRALLGLPRAVNRYQVVS